MTKEEKISDEAAAAETEVDFWSLFMSNDIIAEITLRTMEWKNLSSPPPPHPTSLQHVKMVNTPTEER
jgi:hypothetical protein